MACCANYSTIGEWNGMPVYYEPGPKKSVREMLAEIEARKHESPDPIVQALKDYSTCDIADALVKLGDPHGGFLSGITMFSPSRQSGPVRRVGPAYTVKYVLKSDTDAPKYEGSHYIDTIPAHSILYITGPPRTTNALYGGLMSARAQNLHASGAIIDGRIRDLSEHQDLNFPVFARSVGVAPPGSLLRVSEVGGPVQHHLHSYEGGEGGHVTTIHPGDYLIADVNGVVCVPKDSVNKVLKLVPSATEADGKVFEDLENGVGFEEASRERRAGVLGVDDLDQGEMEKEEDVGEEEEGRGGKNTKGKVKGKRKATTSQGKGKARAKESKAPGAAAAKDESENDVEDAAQQSPKGKKKSTTTQESGKGRKRKAISPDDDAIIEDEMNLTPPVTRKRLPSARKSKERAVHRLSSARAAPRRG